MASTAEPTEAKAVIMITDVSGLIFWACFEDLEPVHLLHLDVGHDDVEVFLFDAFDAPVRRCTLP